MKRFTATLLTVLLGLYLCPSCLAASITESAFRNPAIIDFDSLSTGTLKPGGTNPFPGVTFTGYVTGAFGQAPFLENELRSGFPVGLDDIVRADFSVPVSRVGANAYGPGASGGEISVLTIRAYDTALNLLDEYSVYPTHVPDHYNFVAPLFLGLETTAPIFRVEFISSGISGYDTFPGIDLFRYEAVPEPNAVALMAVAVLSFIVWPLQRRSLLHWRQVDQTVQCCELDQDLTGTAIGQHRNSFRSTSRRVLLGCILFLLCSHPRVLYATTVSDPLGDLFGGSLSHDIASASASYDSTHMFMSATFRPGTLNVSNFAFFFSFDLDQNSSTGVQPPAFFPLGADWTVSFNSLVDPFRASVIGFPVPVSFKTDSFSLAVPLSLLGDDGAAYFGLIVGEPRSTTSFTPFDVIPNSADGNPLNIPTSYVPNGDYNGDARVDAADYVLWRKNDSTPAGYQTWRAHFGRTAVSGAALPSAEPRSAAARARVHNPTRARDSSFRYALAPPLQGRSLNCRFCYRSAGKVVLPLDSNGRHQHGD